MTLPGTIMIPESTEEAVMSILVDCGASQELVDRKYISSLGLKPVKLMQPVKLQTIDGEINSTNDITHEITLEVLIGAQIFKERFLVTNLAPEHPMVFGLSWFKRYDPDFHWPTTSIRSYRNKQPRLRITEEHTQADSKPIKYGPTTDTRLAFAAGGVISAIDTEQYNRQQAETQALTILHLRSALTARTEEMAYVRAFSANVTGLSGNKEGWLKTIPTTFHEFAPNVFSDESAAKMPPHRKDLDCSIDIKEGEKLSTCKIYDMSKDQLETLKQLLDAQLAKGFIRPSTSPASSPVFFVTDKGKMRLVIDYRNLNRKIELNEYPIPLSRTVMERLPLAKIFSKFDVRVGFQNLRIREGDEWKTAFKTFFGLYEYTVMPMGLATAPSIFQRFINQVLAPYLDLFCFAYLDDIVIFSETLEQHEEHTRLILQALKDNDLHLNPAKCEWNTTSMEFLGFTAVAGRGIRMSDDKLQALRSWKIPTTVKEVRMFTGTVNFYHAFIPHYSDIVSPLTNLTKKNTDFLWDENCQRAWDTLMAALREDVFVQGPQAGYQRILETDASDVAYGGVISQFNPATLLNEPIQMFSHKFKDEESRWTVAEKELYAIIFALKRYPHLLCNDLPVKIFTDHRNLARFTLNMKLSGKLGRWYDEILRCGINFEIQYRPGQENTVADALSRYGMDAADDGPQYAPILPLSRFSPKAQQDLTLLRKELLATGNRAKTLAGTRKFGLDLDRYVKKSDPASPGTGITWQGLSDTWNARPKTNRAGLGWKE